MKTAIVWALAGGTVSARGVFVRDTTTILNDIADISSDTQALTTAIDNYQSLNDASAVINAEMTLDNAIKKGTSDAKATTGPLSSSDSASILTAVKNLIPYVVASLNAATNKAATFNSDGVESVVQGDLQQLQSDTNAFGTALISIAPASATSAASVALACINSAFAAAEATVSASDACASNIVIPSGSSSISTPASTSTPASSSAPTSSSSSISGPASGSTSSPASTSTPVSSSASASSSSSIPVSTSTPCSSSTSSSAASSTSCSSSTSSSAPISNPCSSSGSIPTPYSSGSSGSGTGSSGTYGGGSSGSTTGSNGTATGGYSQPGGSYTNAASFVQVGSLFAVVAAGLLVAL